MIATPVQLPKHSGLRPRLITSESEFAGCRESWNAVAGDNVFCRHEWMHNWWRSFRVEGRDQLVIVVLTDSDGRWVGFAPWYLTRSMRRGYRIRQLASGSACSDYASLAAVAGREEEVGRCLANTIDRADLLPSFPAFDLLEIEAFTRDDAIVGAFLDRLAATDILVNTQEFAGTWRSELGTSWREYENRLHKSFRRKTRKAASRLLEPAYSAQVCTTPSGIEQHWQTFVQLHQRRRESLGEPGCFADPRFEQFLRRATTELAATGRSQINLFHLDGKPLAANLEFAAGDAVFMYQTGFDPDLIRLEPGHITFTWALGRAIERGFRWFDFLRGDEPYKSRWKSSRVPLYRSHIVPDRRAARLRYGVWSAGRHMRGWMQSLSAPAPRAANRLPSATETSDQPDDSSTC
jgi:CelD/BcsL family acetyltransferase involved in cellulose biosynthesis